MILQRIRHHLLYAPGVIACAVRILPIALISLVISAPCLSGFVSHSFFMIIRQHHQQQNRIHGFELSMAAKSGGKLIRDEKDFVTFVLDCESSRPVMVFFTAPW